jgi:phage-related protein
MAWRQPRPLATISPSGAPRNRLPVEFDSGRVDAVRLESIPTVGVGTIEIRVHAGGEYRVFYLAKFEDAIYVLHVFAKKTRKTAPLDLELGKKRYREVLERRK